MDENFFPGDMNGFSDPQRFNSMEDRPFDSVDPRLLSGTNTPMDAGIDAFHHDPSDQLLGPSDCDLGLYSDAFVQSQSQFFEPDMALPYEPLRHQKMGHRRSVSVPPEDMAPPEQSQPPIVFHRGGTPLGDSLGTPKSNKRWLKKASQKKARHSPYQPSSVAPNLSPAERMGLKRTHTQPAFAGPTSAPTPARMPYIPEEQNPISALSPFDVEQFASPRTVGYPAPIAPMHRAQVSTDLIDLDALHFSPRNNATTTILGMLGFAGRLTRDCEAMAEFLTRGFRNSEDDELENTRQEKRALNRTISKLTDPLIPMPLPTTKADTSNLESHVPTTGLEIRDLDVEKTHALLDLYGVPFAADEFLHEKKLAYLRFAGASRKLMHAVLD